MTDKPDWQEKLIKALDTNEYCEKNILLSRRIFFNHKLRSPEALVTLTIGACDNIFGHVFEYRGKWIVCLISLFECPIGSTEEELIENFWDNVPDFKFLRLIPIEDDECIFKLKSSFREATDCLVQLIEDFHWLMAIHSAGEEQWPGLRMYKKASKLRKRSAN